MKYLRNALVAIGLALPGAALAGGTPATLYKSPTCGCCSAYADYLEGHGFDVDVVVRDDPACLELFARYTAGGGAAVYLGN